MAGRNETRRNETKRKRTNEMKKMKRIEFSELPKLHAICNRWMHFFCSLLVVILGFWRACKKTSTAPSAHYFGLFFFMRKIAKFCCDLERFPELGTIFRKTKSCGPIVGDSSRHLTKLSGMLRFGVRFSRRTFGPVLECSRFGGPICRPKNAACRIGIQLVGNQKT